MSKFKSDPDKKYLKIVNDLRKSANNAYEIYAEVTHKETFDQLQKQYGAANNKCFCRLFRERCIKNDGTCDYGNNGVDSWRDHGQMFQKDSHYTFISHPYRISYKAFKDIHRICNEHNLEVEIDSRESSWFPSQTTAIIIKKSLTN